MAKGEVRVRPLLQIGVALGVPLKVQSMQSIASIPAKNRWSTPEGGATRAEVVYLKETRSQDLRWERKAQ